MQGLNMLLHPDEEHTDRTLMESMMGDQHIGPEAWQRGAAARNLYHNVSRMIQRCQNAGVPVIVCTQPTNEKDIAPIGGERLNHLSSEDRNEVESLLHEAEILVSADPPAAERLLRTALKSAPSDGRMHYLLGKTLLQQQEIDAASDAFRTARDLDSMPWRAPTLSQESVLRAAMDHDSQICDLTEAFRSESANGLIGWELMDDHVHPNLRGQALTAEALMGCLTNFDGALNVSREAVENRSSWEHYAQLLGENVFDRYAAAHSMRILFAAPFMRENNQGAFGRYDAIARRIELQMPVSVRDAMTEWQETQAYAGSRCPITAAVAQVLLKEDDYSQALDLYEIALKAVPDYTSWRLEYMYYSMFCRERLNGDLTRNDLARIQAASEQGTVLCDQVESSLGFNERFTGFLHLLCGEYGKAIPFLLDSRRTSTGIDRLAVEQALFLCFLENRRFDEARLLVLEGAARKDEFALRYQSLLDALPELMEAVGNPE